MTDIVPVRRAPVSVSDKAGLVPFAAALTVRGDRPLQKRTRARG